MPVLGIDSPFDTLRTLGKGGGVIDGWDAYGDSLVEGSSGGGGGTYYFTTQLSRYLSYLGLPSTVINHGTAGETSTQVADRAVARSAQYRNLIFWAGRNENIAGTSQAALVALVVGNAQRVINTLRSGQTLWVFPVHNGNYEAGAGREGATGGLTTNYTKIMAINSGLAALDNGTTVRFLDTRALLVNHYVIGNFQDESDFGEDQPASTTTAVDGRHPDSIGYNEIVRSIAWAHYLTTTLYAARGNLITDTGTAAWTQSNSPTFSYSAGLYTVAATAAFSAVAQAASGSGYSGKRLLLHWNIQDPSGANKIQMRPFVGGGSDFPVSAGYFGNPFFYKISPGSETPGVNLANRKKSMHQMIFVDANTSTAAILLGASNDAAASFKFSNPIVQQIT